jgi:hypothetical protein
MPAVPMGVVFQRFSCSEAGQPEGLSYAPEVQETYGLVPPVFLAPVQFPFFFTSF